MCSSQNSAGNDGSMHKGCSEAFPLCRHQASQHRAQLQPDDVRIRAGQRPGHDLQSGPTCPQQEPGQHSGCPQWECLWLTVHAPPADEDGTGMCVLMRDLTSSSLKDFISQKSSAVGSLNEPMSHFRIKLLWKTRTFDQDKVVCFTQDISRLKHPNFGANTRYLMKTYMNIWRFEESDIFTDHKTDNFVCESSKSMMELA